jgi:hypothetical protein
MKNVRNLRKNDIRTDIKSPATNKTSKSLKSKSNKMVDCIILHVTGAVYSCGDVIIFEVLQEICGEMYLQVSIQYDEVMEDVYIFKWCDIPEEVRAIYEFANTKSTIVDNVLYGAHILRKDDSMYALCKFRNEPVGTEKSLPYKEYEEYDGQMFIHLAMHMNQVKELKGPRV